MMKIKKIKVNGKFKYLWGKYINGIDLNNHCAKTFIGEYSKKIKANMGNQEDLLLDEVKDFKVFYLCGVAMPFVWENNFHLAIMEKEGETLTVERNGIYVEIENAVELPINFDINNCNHKKAKFKTYNTCRNWQFAYIYQDIFK